MATSPLQVTFPGFSPLFWERPLLPPFQALFLVLSAFHQLRPRPVNVRRPWPRPYCKAHNSATL